MVTAEVLDGWNAARRTTPGGQSVYSGNRDGHDAAPGFSSGVASNRGTDGFYFRPAGCATEHA